MDLAFWFDPGCPWSWITSRWIEEVRGPRDLQVQWKPFSLYEKNRRGRDVRPDFAEVQEATHELLRVCEAVRAEHGNDAVGALYTDLGTAIHQDEDRELADLPGRLDALGLEPGLADAREDASLDPVITASMAEALESAGEEVGTPLIRVGAATNPVFFGPILSPAPTGAAALELFDGLAAVQQYGAGGFYELKRTREVGPQFSSRS